MRLDHGGGVTGNRTAGAAGPTPDPRSLTYDSYGLGHAFDEDGVNYYMLLASRLILLALCRAVI